MHMYRYICIDIHMHIDRYMHTYIRPRLRRRLSKRRESKVYIHMHTYIYIYAHICIYMHIHSSVRDARNLTTQYTFSGHSQPLRLYDGITLSLFVHIWCKHVRRHFQGRFDITGEASRNVESLLCVLNFFLLVPGATDFLHERSWGGRVNLLPDV